MPVITGSVGEDGLNRLQDVKTIQILLNNNLRLLVPFAPLPVSGLVDNALCLAIEEYQRRVLNMQDPDGRVDPHGRTLRALTLKRSNSAEVRGNPITTAGEINTPLPHEGVGFKSYKTQDTQYGYSKTVDFIKTLGAEWAKRNGEGPRLLIGDLSIKGGGRTPKQWGHPKAGYHKSHGSGVDFDIQIIRSDNKESPRSVTVEEPAPDGCYDRERTQLLVDLIRDIAGKDFGLILSADTKLKDIHHEGTHRYHLHVRLTK